MSTGGVFKLIANDGKADRMIMATALLNQRIKDVMCARKSAGKADLTPTLVDIERTHVLFVNAHFKPFAAIGYEYNKVRAQSGNPVLGGTITFSIPQFGDFFFDMVGRQTLSAFNSTVQTAPDPGDTSSGGTVYPVADNDWDNATIIGGAGQLVAGATYSLVDMFGNAVADGGAGGTFRNPVRLCEYPGERLYKSVKFDVNNSPLDEYYDITINMMRKFTIGADKIVGYKMLVGQEHCKEGFTGPKNCYTVDSNNTGAAPFTTFGLGALDNLPTIPQHSVTPVSNSPADFIAAGFPDNAWDVTLGNAINHTVAGGAASFGYLSVNRQCLSYVDGPQTPKYQQPRTEIWNKLRFWFNDDARLSVPSVSIPFGQRFITIDLAEQNLLAFEFPGLYIRQIIDSGPVGAGVGPGQSTLNTRTVKYRPWISAGTISTIDLQNVELYVNNIFVNPEVHDIFIKRIGFSLIRVNRRHTHRTNNSDGDEVQLTSLKWPIEYMFVGLRPAWNVSSNNPQQWRDWHRMTKINDILCDEYDLAETVEEEITAVVGQGPPVTVDIAVAIVPGSTGHSSRIGKVVPDNFVKELKTVDTMTITAHAINIYDTFPEKFFSAYTPFHYGGTSIVTPSDEGALMVNFALYPGSYQPSGHINLSRAREFFVKWTTRYVSPTSPSDLLVAAKALNFLLVTDGSAVLRYST